MLNTLVYSTHYNNTVAQINTIKQIPKTGSLSIIDNMYEKYLMHSYHFVRFDVVNDQETCKKIALTFSNNPDIFLGNKRTEIQIADLSVTLSLNDWIKCTNLINYTINYYVEYYVQVYNNFPVAIFFRIRKDIDQYEDKLMNFIDCLTNDFNPNKNKRLMITNPVKTIEYNGSDESNESNESNDRLIEITDDTSDYVILKVDKTDPRHRNHVTEINTIQIRNKIIIVISGFVVFVIFYATVLDSFNNYNEYKNFENITYGDTNFIY